MKISTPSSQWDWGWRPIYNLRFVDDIDLLKGSNEELQELTDRLVDRVGTYGMEVSSEKSKVMLNSSTNTTMSMSNSNTWAPH